MGTSVVYVVLQKGQSLKCHLKTKKKIVELGRKMSNFVAPVPKAPNNIFYSTF